MEFLIQPEHFQGTFMIMGVLYSVGLIVLLWDILSNKKLGVFKLMISGLFACILVTFVNLFFFYTVLWTPITRDTEEMKDKWGGTAIPERTIRTGEYETNTERLANNYGVALAILGYGGLMSVIFIFIAMIRSLGNPSCHNHHIFKCNLGVTFNKYTIAYQIGKAFLIFILISPEQVKECNL